MDQAKILNFKKALSESNNVLIVLPEYINTDTISAASSIYNYITHSLKKNVFFASNSTVPVRFNHIVSTAGVDETKHLKEIKPLQYVVRVQGNEKDMPIDVNRKDDEIDFVMTPKDSEIDLTKITVTTVGNKFDLFIFINAHELSDAGNIYDNNEELFKKQKPYVISSNYDTKDTNTLNSNENTTASETVYEILEMFGANVNQAIKDVLFEGIVSGTDGLHKVNSSNALETVLKLSSQKDLSEKMKNLFYGFSTEGLELRKKIFANLKQVENIIYSELNESDLNSLGIEPSQLNGIDYLPFSIVEDTDTYYVFAYQNGDGRIILIQNPNISDIFTKLKNLGYKVSRSNNIIAIDTKNSLETVLKLFSEKIEIESDTDYTSSQQYENPSDKVEEKEQPLFENNNDTDKKDLNVENKNEEKADKKSEVKTDLPFTPVSGSNAKSDTPFQQANK